MSKNLQSPTKLTEFAPLQEEEKPQGVSQFISKLFKINRAEETSSSSSSLSSGNNNAESSASVQQLQQQQQDTITINSSECSSNNSIPNIYLVDLNEGRSLPNVLKRISNLLALKSNNLQDYADTELKQYWMPDAVSKECYECSEKFTTFRRKHHCRVCGQIFCSQCCNQQIPGKIFGCTGDLRVCTYCCKVVLSYLQSSNNFGASLSVDLKDLQESLQNKFGGECSSIFENSPSLSSSSVNNLKFSSETNEIQRKISVGYQEEKFIGSECNSETYLTNEEKSRALQNSLSLRNLYEEICKNTTGLNFTPFKYRLKTYPDSFLGSELVDWLICQQKANNRIQAAALAQALLEGNYIESFTEIRNFVDGYLRYRKGTFNFAGFTQTSPNIDYPGEKEHSSSWVHHHESSNTDSDNEQLSASPPVTQTAIISSSTSFTLNLNVEANSAYLSRPPESPETADSVIHCPQHEETVVRPSEQRELAPESGWFQASTLREENGEKEAFELLSEAYEQHEQSLLKQLLSAKNLPTSWSDILLPLTRDVVSTIRPDKNHDAIQLDIRNYVQIKKLPSFNKNDTYLVNGVVFSKNVAHKEMTPALENPKILLLECSIVYQRTEGRLMSLEPVLMQEQEYLRHVVARIAALQPNVVLIQRNISRLAQDMLRKYNITLVHNVKRSVLERLARCTEADIVQSVDAHIGRPKLGSCKRFYLKNFLVENTRKTLMFFEGLPRPYLGATILLGGAFKDELIKVKKLAQFLIFTAYNWRLEKSFLMDEFALPPNSRMEFLDDISKENSPQTDVKPLIPLMEKKISIPENNKESYFDPLQSEPKKIHVESVNDQSDPLQSDLNILKENFNQEILTVSELGISNNFKKYLEDTILCISPYVIFPMPYLESDVGKKCKLRQFFYKDNYFSEQFMESSKNTKRKNLIIIEELHKPQEENKLPELHSFLTAKITITHDNSLQNRLALFRACGSRFPKKEILEIKQLDRPEEKPILNSHLDVLDPQNHQKLAVLFYSFSHESNNAPAFCVTPWVVSMDFYGKNDIPLGCFLERYCFRSTYSCPSKTCVTPMVKHIRRFVHNSGSITISLNNFENEYAEENIVMWSWCTKCTSVSPVVPLSVDSWSYSFAKYLELRFHGDIFNRRGLNPCRHSLHQDHYHYFGYKSYVASFKYTPINLWEISLPPFIIETDYNMDNLHENLIEEAKFLAQKSHDLFALVLDRVLDAVASNGGEELLENVGNVRQIINKEQTNFKQKLEHIQIKLTSPTVEFKEFDLKIVKEAYWKIQESIGKLKGSLTEFVDTWNNHLSESIRKSDRKKEKNQILDPLETPTMEECEENLLYREETITHLEESSPDKREIKKEITVKNLLDKLLLPSSTSQNLIPSPFSLQDHYNLTAGVYGTIPVFENEFSSIIAYALNSFEYKKSLEELISRKTQFFDPSSTNSPLLSKRRNLEEDEKTSSTSIGLLGFLRNESNSISDSDQSVIIQTPPVEEKNPKNSYIEIEFKDPLNCAFFCRIYCAESFANLRLSVLEKSGGEETFIHSLSRCIQWKAVGGKSGSSFFKTLDDRFILKGMSRPEVHMFMESSANYFAYMQKCAGTKQPTLLGKIVGIYQIRYNNSALSLAHRMYLLVMENLFYKRNVSQKFDLKGSMRNRLVVPDNREGDIVLQDENLSKMICENPLYVYPHSKEVFLAAIQNDTEFLSTQSVMDYSLLVGLDTKNNELVLGIIDYIRTFTLDKKLETMVKRSGILGGQGKLPTIVSPEEYQKRFIEAMHRYFLEVPDHFSGLAKGLLDI